VRIVGSWCQREGRADPLIREVEPREDERISHGMRNEHALGVLLASRYAGFAAGVPRRRLRVTVRRDRPDLRAGLTQALAAIDDVEIVVDRRRGERRRQQRPVSRDRRLSARRRAAVAANLESMGWAGVLEPIGAGC